MKLSIGNPSLDWCEICARASMLKVTLNSDAFPLRSFRIIPLLRMNRRAAKLLFGNLSKRTIFTQGSETLRLEPEFFEHSAGSVFWRCAFETCTRNIGDAGYAVS
jgi:hypothetical protein